MRIGVTLPQHVIGVDSVALRDCAQAAEGLGFDHLVVYEHVILPDAASHPGQNFNSTNQISLHEPLVLCGFLAAATQRIGLQTTDVLILPLRDTLIVGKQTAELDVLSGGRLCLGVGAGWLEFEFLTLGRDFHSRGARLDEHMALLRALWTTPAVTSHGREHHIDGAGLNPLPVQRPIPLWVGGGVRASVRRAARRAAGWIAPGPYTTRPGDDAARQLVDWLHLEAAAMRRPPEDIGVQGLIGIGGLAETEWTDRAEGWRQVGATDLLVDTVVSAASSDPSLSTVSAQMQALARIRAALEPAMSPRPSGYVAGEGGT
jgi:probable F420-dependent oxidoreductase